MRGLKFLLLTGTALLSFAACKKEKQTETPGKTYGKLTVNVSNEIKGNAINFGAREYTNEAGNLYSVNLLKYYISNFTLIANDNSERNFGNYKLINGMDTATCHFSFDSVTNGTYKAIRFSIGVDSGRNHSGLQEGDLDPINGMIWTWQTGYIFFKHEGQFTSSRGTTAPIIFHLGTDKAFTTIELPVAAFQINSNDKTVSLKLDLNTLYKTPNVIDFNYDSVRQSTAFEDDHWINQMKANLANSFTVSKVE